MFIENGKKPDDAYHASLSFWLPPDNPYGNFQLKYMKIVQRLDEANRKIADSYKFWEACKTGGMIPIGAYECHVFANEEAIYMLRRAADELISLIWCLSKYEEDGEYPRKIKINCLASVIHQNDDARHEAFKDHIGLMTKLNDISNAFKHSFINSNHTLWGSDEPCIHALALGYDNLNKEPVFHNVTLSSVVEKYNAFYRSCNNWLKQYSEKNR
ncbi:hypothetical protein ACT3TQ_07320 [Halomonas sp. AOP12-C2-37]|uniref:hypothetical protein n=1 Tax=unclassified Halomonas TaxID=2609666 RepID=UPI00403414AC